MFRQKYNDVIYNNYVNSHTLIFREMTAKCQQQK